MSGSASGSATQLLTSRSTLSMSGATGCFGCSRCVLRCAILRGDAATGRRFAPGEPPPAALRAGDVGGIAEDTDEV